MKEIRWFGLGVLAAALLLVSPRVTMGADQMTLTEKIAKILKNQEQIIQKLQNIQTELDVIRVRVTRH